LFAFPPLSKYEVKKELLTFSLNIHYVQAPDLSMPVHKYSKSILAVVSWW